jgi:uncharacterized membrane protein YozB (DUF420 family)
VARAIFGIGAIAWSLGFVAALAVAIFGVEALLALLPPLQIDTAAVSGAVTAVAAGFALAAVTHLAVLTGLRRRWRRAWSAAILLASLLAAVFVALAAASLTSAVAQPTLALALSLAGAGATAVALGYALATVRLVGELRSWTRG